MALLAGINYDPATAVSASTAALLAMTALDTTNLRLTFTTPTNGCVMVRLRCTIAGATTWPTILLGILEGSTVIARQVPLGGLAGQAAVTTAATQEALFTITGLTAGSHTWDAAYAVQVLLTSTNIQYGGPNDTTASNAWGGFSFEIYDCPTLLGSKMYDPVSAVSKTGTPASVIAALDTTNLRIAFTAPASGNVLVRMRGVIHGATAFPQMMLGVLQSATIIGRSRPIGGLKTTAVATAQLGQEAQFIVTGLSGSLTWDAAYGVETAVAATGLKYGGPNDTVGNDAFGGFLFEVWAL